MKLLSIVVPIYNVENYLKRCINTLLYFDSGVVDIILVNDGSTDSSFQICKYYGGYSNIRIINKENGGLSDARNAGLAIVNSEYVWFIDSDDYIEDKCSEIIERLTKFKPDIMIMNFSRVINSREIPYNHRIKENTIFSGQEYIKEAIVSKEYVIPVWSNIYRKTLFDNRKFVKGIYHEDEQIAPYLFLDSEKILVTHINSYRYVLRKNSIVNSKKYEKNLKDMFGVFIENSNYYNSVLTDNVLIELLHDDMAEKIIYALSRYDVPSSEVNRYISYKFIKEWSNSKKNKIRYLMFRYFRSLYRIVFSKNEEKKLKIKKF